MALTLVELRTKAAEVSGRYDLVDVDDDYSDDGMDFFIHSAQTFLDKRAITQRSTNVIYDEKATGTWYYDFTRCQKIEDVWINNAEGRNRLEKKTLNELKELYPGLISETDQGTPLYYTPLSVRSTEDTDMDNLGAFFNHTKDASDAYRSILMLPPPDEAIVVELTGIFYADVLTEETDTNFWTNNYPDLFLMAILYKLETFNRSDRAIKYWRDTLDAELIQIDMNMVSEEVHEVNQIEG